MENLLTDAFIALHWADDCGQQCDASGVKVSVDQALPSRGPCNLCGSFWNAREQGCGVSRSNGHEMVQGPFVLRSKVPVP